MIFVILNSGVRQAREIDSPFLIKIWVGGVRKWASHPRPKASLIFADREAAASVYRRAKAMHRWAGTSISQCAAEIAAEVAE